MGKHSAEKSTKKNKSKKIIFIIVIVLCVIAGIAFYLIQNNNNKGPEIVINNLFSALKQGNKAEANKYIEYDQLIASLDEMLLTNNKDQASEIEKELFKDVEWQIENIEIEEDKATAVIEVTNKDFKNVITTWMKKVVSEKTAGSTISNELALEKLEEVLKEDSENKKTIIKKINLSKENKSWKAEVNDDLRDLVFPGIDSVISVLNPNEK